jgi:GT2 family glycosyltransferase
MALPKVTIQIVSYNSLRYLKGCFDSLLNQTYRDFQIIVIDNDSQDGTVDFIKKNYHHITVIRNSKNAGFAKANNQGIKIFHSPYVLLCNPDITLEPDWLEKMMEIAESEKYKETSSFCGKLLKMKIVNVETTETEKTDTIDSCGLKILKSHQVVELGAGKSVKEFNSDREVFGCSGALVLYRREALEQVMLKGKGIESGEYFDEDIFFYKEDVDLAWRLRLAGWQAHMIPGAIAYHVRALAGAEGLKVSQVIKNRRKQHKMGRYYSYRNHLLMLIKNQFRSNFFKYFFPIIGFELRKIGYLLIFEWSTLRAWGGVIKLWPQMRRKRKLIFQKTRISAVDMQKWIGRN